MTQKPENPSAASEEGRTTRRGLGVPEPRSASGAFPREWPELSDAADSSPEMQGADEPSEPTRVFEARPQSRGPEYHPPSVPASSRERAFLDSGSSGTFRVGAPASVQVRATYAPEGGAPRPSSPTVPPLERGLAAATWRRFGSARFLSSAAVGLLLGSGVALAVVRVPVRAWGVLKVNGVPESLGASVAGSVVAVQVGAGEEVEPGDAVLQIHAPDLERMLESRRSELEFLRREHEAALSDEKAELTRNLGTIERRRRILTQRLELKDAELAQRKALVEEVAALVNAGSVPSTDLAMASAAVQATSEERLGIVDDLSQLDIDTSDRRSDQRSADRHRRLRLAEAEAELRQAEAALDVATVRAPAQGWIESMLVTPGSTVQAGAELARLVPRSAPRSIVALVAVEDAADVAVGEEASVELASHQSRAPLSARVRHVSREVAPPTRVQAILGGPSRDGFVQLELELIDSTEYHTLEPQLRTGSRARVSFSTPHRRLGRVLYEAVREWFSFESWG